MKVNEPNRHELWQCPRCSQDYCAFCIDKHIVDFDIIDGNDMKPSANIQWRGLMVCPWCYNQLLKKMRLVKNEKIQNI